MGRFSWIFGVIPAPDSAARLFPPLRRKAVKFECAEQSHPLARERKCRVTRKQTNECTTSMKDKREGKQNRHAAPEGMEIKPAGTR